MNMFKAFWNLITMTEAEACAECPVAGHQDCNKQCQHFEAMIKRESK